MEKFKKRAKYIFLIFIVMIFIGIATTPSKEEQKEITKQEIKNLKEKLQKNSVLDVETNLYTIKQILEHEPNNEKLKNEYKKYTHLDNVAKSCRIETKKRDKASLHNPNSYDNQEYKRYGWVNEKVYIINSTFTGKNAYNVEFKYNSEYKCIIKKDGVTIEQNYFRKI